jgi:prevent-host-death family protein
MNVSVHGAKTQLSKLLDMVEDGESVVIERHGRLVAQLVPVRKRRVSPLGAMRGQFTMGLARVTIGHHHDHRLGFALGDEIVQDEVRPPLPSRGYVARIQAKSIDAAAPRRSISFSHLVYRFQLTWVSSTNSKTLILNS